MTAELARRDTDTWAQILPSVGHLAELISTTDFVPDAMRGKPAAIAACMLYGREIGLGPMQSLRSVNVIKGKPSLSAEAMRSMILAAGHRLVFVETTSTRCVLQGQRAGESDTLTVTYSLEDAKQAGLTGRDSQYEKRPRAMLAARATSELARLLFADTIGGLVGEVEAEDELVTDSDGVVQEPARKAPTRTVKPRALAAVPTTTSAPNEGTTAPGAEELPPLPGEAEPVGEPPVTPPTAPPAPTTPVAPPAVDVPLPLGDVGPAEAPPPRLVRPGDAPRSDVQSALMHRLFNRLGVADRQRRLELTRAIVRRPELGSSTELTKAEAIALIDTLAEATTLEQLEAIITVIAAGGTVVTGGSDDTS